MTDHNARQAGLLDLINAYGRACRRDGSPAWESEEGQALHQFLAAHSADARNGEGVLPARKEVPDAWGQDLGGNWEAGYADGWNECLEEVSALLAAPAAPAPHANCPAPVDATEAAEREHLGCAHCNTGSCCDGLATLERDE